MNTPTDSMRLFCVNHYNVGDYIRRFFVGEESVKETCRILWLGNQGEYERTVSFVLYSVTAQAVNRRPLTVDAQVRSQASL